MHVQNSLDALSQHGDERQDEHGVFLHQVLQFALNRELGVFAVHHFADFEAPFVLELVDAQKGSAHEGDDDAGEDPEDAFPDVLGGFEGVAACGIDCGEVRHMIIEGWTSGEAGMVTSKSMVVVGCILERYNVLTTDSFMR